AHGPDRVRGIDAGHADPAAAVRPLLRDRGSDPSSGVRGGPAGPGAELRGLRERNLSCRARGGPAGTVGGRTDAWTERAPGVDARPRTAGAAPGPRADDERLHRAAEGLVPRLRPDRHGAHQADADFRDQPGEL